MKQTRHEVAVGLFAAALLGVGGCHPAPQLHQSPMVAVAARPAPCKGAACHTCAPVPEFGFARPIYEGSFDLRDFDVGDLDGDGIPDEVFSVVKYPGGPHDGDVGVLLDRGVDGWSAPTFFSAGTAPGALVVQDVNGDGWPDVLALDPGDGTHPGWVDVLQGLPGGRLNRTGGVAVGRRPTSLAVRDVNGDGHPDLVVTNGGDGTLGVCLGRGDGTFADETTFSAGPDPTTVALGDYDGDGHLDAAVAGSLMVEGKGTGTITVLRGHGDGTFASGRRVTTLADLAGLKAADLNGDGHADLVTSDGPDGTVRLLMGRKDGTFVPGTPIRFENSKVLSFALGDLDGDGDADLVVQLRSLKYTDATRHSLQVLHNDGDGHFTLAGQAFGGWAFDNLATTLVLADMNGDGAPDLVVGGTVLRTNRGDGTFPAPTPEFFAGSSGKIWGGSLATAEIDGDRQSLVDVNGDGRPDLTRVRWYLAPNVGPVFHISVLLGQPDGTLAPGPTTDAPDPYGGRAVAIAVGDVDGDGVPDLVAVTQNGTILVFRGRGDGSFVPQGALQVTGIPSSLILADVNGDGHPDLVLALRVQGSGSAVAVLLGRGDGTFKDAVISPLGSDCRDCNAPAVDLALGDLNGDGVPDLVVDNGRLKVLLGHGDGTFTAGDGSYPAVGRGLALHDLDGDGKLDAVTDGSDGWNAGMVAVLRGRGDGTFGKAVDYPVDARPYNTGEWDGRGQVVVADLDGDGVPDLVVPDGVLHGRGDGTFDPPVVFFDDVVGEPLAVADMDGNGQPDLVLPNSLGPVGVVEILDPPPVCTTR